MSFSYQRSRFTSGLALALSLPFAQAAQAHTRETPSVKQTIQKICASPKKPLVIDTFAFSDKVVGGAPLEKPEYTYGSHGDVVGGLLGKDYNAYNLSSKAYSSSGAFAAALQEVLQKIQSGELETPSFINLSIGMTINFKDFNIAKSLHLTPANLWQYKQEIYNEFASEPTLKKIHDILQEFKQRGITIVTGTGNESSPNRINLLSLMPGTLTAGALDDNRIIISYYTNNNSLIDFFRKGNVHGRAVPGGVDLTGDGIADIKHPPPEPRKDLHHLQNKKAAETSLPSAPEKVLDMDGTSFAAPRICNPDAGFIVAPWPFGSQP